MKNLIAFSELLSNLDVEKNEFQRLSDLYYILENLSIQIIDYRRSHNLSQKGLAQKLGITQAMVSKMESGDYNFTVEHLHDIACALGGDFSPCFDLGSATVYDTKVHTIYADGKITANSPVEIQVDDELVS